MSENELEIKLIELLSLENDDENSIITRIDKFIRFFGTQRIESWQNSPKRQRNSFLHELVDKGWLNVVRHVIKEYELNVNVKRQSDDLTPLQMAQLNQNSKMCDLLLALGADPLFIEDIEAWEAKKDKEKTMNIVWLDLEMTSLEDPHILECAVIITDKDLQELERGQWVIHFDQDVLDGLDDWHQNTFKDLTEGGNGLFAEVVASKNTKEEVEQELLLLLKRHCPEKMCSLAGSSIHIDKEVLKLRMPEVHNYLHYRIIDVSSFRAMMKRWAPWTEAKFLKRLVTNGREIVNHRAMDDIEWSIEFMKLFRPLLSGKLSSNKMDKKPWSNHHHRSASAEAAARNIEQPTSAPHHHRSELYADEKRLLQRLQFEQTFDVKILHLNKRDQNIYDRNPHLREVFINRQRIQFEEQDFTIKNRLLTPSINSKLNVGQVSTTEYWGQRKLLLTEIEFLTNYGADGQYLVIYVGAAPGSHVNYLSSLFPDLEFALIDTKEFVAVETDQIHILPEGFTEDLAEQYTQSKNRKLFICNVHTFTAHNNLQSDIMEDMANQKTWHKLLRPRASLLNFRLPRTPGKTSFFQGDLIIEPWASKRNIECRIVVQQGARMIDYDSADFEQAMVHFHNVTRITYYKHNINEIETEGLDHCYDCQAEIFILQQYLTKCRKITKESDLKQAIATMSSTISKSIQDKNRKSAINTTRTLDVIQKK